MRPLLVLPFLCLAVSPALAAPRRPLELPIRNSDAVGASVRAPCYAGDVLTIRLTPEASRAAWQWGRVGTPVARLGVPGLDRVLADLDVRLEPLFPWRTPPPAGSDLQDMTAFYTVRLPRGLGLEAALDRLAALSDVSIAEPVAILPVSALPPSDSLFANSYWFSQPSGRDLDALNAWAITTGDTSIVVGILDTGVLTYHPDIGGDSLAVLAGQRSQIWTNWEEASGTPGVDDDNNGLVDDVHGWDFVNLGSPNDAAIGEDWSTPDNDPNDYAAHGTAVAGVVGALSDNVHGITGTIWNCRLMPLRIGWACPGTGGGCGEVSMNFVVQGIDYAVVKGASVINCSFQSVQSSPLDGALDNALAAGVTVVSAAGNDGLPIDMTSNYLALRREVISVASVDRNDVVSFFTNFGPQIDLSAPGQQIASTWLVQGNPATPTYHPSLNGTSLSAPFVTGAVALMQARQKQVGRDPLTPEGVALRLDETSDDISDVNGGRVGTYGSGRLNLRNAVSDLWRSSAIRMGGRNLGSPAVMSLTSGSKRIALATTDNKLVVLDGMTLDTVVVAPLLNTPVSGVSVGRLRAAGGVGLFVGCVGGVSGFRPNGTPLAGWPALASPGVQLVGPPAVSDLDADGAYEVVCGTDEGQVWAWHIANPAAPVAGFPVRLASNGIVRVALASLGGAGSDVIATTADGKLTALDAGGVARPNWPITLTGPPTAPVIVYTWGGPTIVVGAATLLHAYQPNGSERAGFPVDLGAFPTPHEEPAIADIDSDGIDEIVITTGGPDRIDVRDSAGLSKTGWPRSLGASVTGSPVVGSLATDPAPEIMVFMSAGLAAFSSAGDSLAGYPKRGGGGFRPSLADLDDDGTTDIVAGSGQPLNSLYVYDAGQVTAQSSHPWPTFRGNYSRTGTRGAPAAVVDDIRPGAVSDLRVVVIGTQRYLVWTAPWDDGFTEAATSYDVRRSGQVITELNFAAATAVPAGVPRFPTTTDSLVLTGLTPGVTYHFALRAVDEEGNVGPVSNDVSVTIPTNGGPQSLSLAPASNPSRVPAALSWQADPRAIGARQALRIHDLGGRVVRTIELGIGAGGVAVWDGEDDDGRPLPAGLYLVRLVSGGYHADARLVLLR